MDSSRLRNNLKIKSGSFEEYSRILSSFYFSIDVAVVLNLFEVREHF